MSDLDSVFAVDDRLERERAARRSRLQPPHVASVLPSATPARRAPARRAPDDGLDSVFAADDRFRAERAANLGPSLNRAALRNPDAVARVNRDARDAGLPPVADILDPAQTAQRATVARASRAVEGAPRLGEWLSEDGNSEVAIDQAPNLSLLEREARFVFDLVRSVAGGTVGVVGSGFLSGTGEGVQTGFRTFDRATRNRYREPEVNPMGFENIGRGRGGTEDGQGLLATAARVLSPRELERTAQNVTSTGQFVERVAERIGPPEERRTFATEVANALGQILGQLGAGRVLGRGGSTVGLVGMGADQGADAAREERQYGTVAGDQMIGAGAVITGVTERMGMDAIQRRLAPRLVSRAFGARGGNLARTLASVGLGVTLEGGQEIGEAAALNAARIALLNPDHSLTDGLLMEGGVAGTAGGIIQALTLLALPGRQRLGIGMQRARVAEPAAAALDRVMEGVRENPLTERSPEHMESFLGEVAEGQDVYIPASAVRSFMQSATPEQQQLILGIEGVEDQLASATDQTDIVIPAATYIARVGPVAGVHEAFRDDLRMGAAASSVNEAKAFEAGFDEQLTSEAAAVLDTARNDETRGASRERVREAVYTMMKAGGFSEAEAREVSDLQANRAAARSLAHPETYPDAWASHEADNIVAEREGRGGPSTPGRGRTLGQFAGPNALTADRTAMNAAEQRLSNGENSETVRKSTGWHRGDDGKMRFEISDHQMQFLPPDKGGVIEKASRFLRRKATSGGLFVLGQKAVDLEAGRRANQWGADPIRLGDLITHDRLFAAYPRLSESRVIVSDLLGTADAALMPNGDILLSANAVLNESREMNLKHLAHEIQHSIQRAEGFASGTSPDPDDQMVGEYQAEYEAEVRRLIVEDFDTLMGMDRGDLVLKQPMPLNEYADLQHESRASRAGWNIYQQAYGEWEARNTEGDRFRMTDEQRKEASVGSTIETPKGGVVVGNRRPATLPRAMSHAETGVLRQEATEARNEARELADSYKAEAGITKPPHEGSVRPRGDLMRRIADAHDAAVHAPTDPATVASYRALKDQVWAQWRKIAGAGVSVEAWKGEGEPYASSADMLRDVRENRHLWFFTTDAGFGEGADAPGHPMLEETGETLADGTPLLANDLFRIVHDFFGHAQAGFQFGPQGELSAYLEHASMFTAEALPALAAETLMQNAWANFGKHLRREDGNVPVSSDPDYIPQRDRPFSTQKAFAAPHFVLNLAEVMGDQARHHHAEAKRIAAARGAGHLTTLPVNEDGTVTLHHFSPVQGLTMADPSRYGANPLTSRSELAERAGTPRKTFYGIGVGQPGGYVPERFSPSRTVGGNHYTTTVKATDLYDRRSDPDGFRGDENAMQAAGYKGYWVAHVGNGMVAAVWEPLPLAVAFEAQQPENFDEPDGPIVLQQSVTLRTGKEDLKRYGLPERVPLKKGGLKHLNIRQVAAALETRQRKRWGKIEDDDTSDESARKIAGWMVDEVLFAINTGKSGVGWYSTEFQESLNILSQIHPELATDQDARDFFTVLLAVSSDGAKPLANMRVANDVYRVFKETGQFVVPKSAGDRGVRALPVVQQLYEKYGFAGMKEVLLAKDTVKNLTRIAEEQGVEFSTGYLASMKLPMATVMLGPKLGAFYANLMGQSEYLTMDRWWSRSFNRYRGSLLTKPTEDGLVRMRELLGQPDLTDEEVIAATIPIEAVYRKRGSTYAAEGKGKNKSYQDGTEIEKAANTLYKAAFVSLEDSPARGSDRSFMIKTASIAVKRLRRRGVDMTVADLQAILWYYEKGLYGELGARESGQVSYADAAREITKPRGDARPGGRPAQGDGQPDAGPEDGAARDGIEPVVEPDTSADPWEEPFDTGPTFFQGGLVGEPGEAPFYSALTKAARESKTSKAPASQWKATLTKTPGVKAEELDSTGVLDWLATNEGGVTRDDLVKFLEGHGVQIEERVLGDRSDINERSPYLYPSVEMALEGASSRGAAVAQIANDSAAYRVLMDNHRDEWLDEDGEVFDDWADAVVDSIYPNGFGSSTKFGAFNLPGAEETRREVLITIPNLSPKFTGSHWNEPNVVAHFRFTIRTDENGKRVFFVEEIQSDLHQKGREQGYATAASKKERRAAREAVRAAERALIAFGQPIMDRAAAGGHAPSAYDLISDFGSGQNRFYAVDSALRVLDKTTYETDRSKPPSFVVDEENGELRGRLGDLRLAMIEAQAQADAIVAGSGIPDAPFKNNAWATLSVKRIIQYAVDNGADSISWTTGQQQVERYPGLEEAIGDVRVSPDAGGVFATMRSSVAEKLVKNKRATGLRPLQRSHSSVLMTKESVVEVFGDDLGGRMVAATTADDAGNDILFDTGDLKIGGDGMRYFYDKIVPNIVNDIGKKHGARVRSGVIRTDEAESEDVASRLEDVRAHQALAGGALSPEEQTRLDDILADERADVYRPDPFSDEAIETHSSTWELKEALIDRSNTAALAEALEKKLKALTPTVHTLDITPSLRETAEGGFTLFQGEQRAEGTVEPSPAARTPQTETPAFKAWFGDSKVVDADGKPLVAYHGSLEAEEVMPAGRAREEGAKRTWLGDLGRWFAAPSLHDGNYDEENAEYVAGSFTEGRDGRHEDGANIAPVYLSIQNPFEVEDDEGEGYMELVRDVRKAGGGEAYRASLQAQGYDGIVIRNSMTDGSVDRDDWVAFRPEQIKSSIGNSGAFDPANPSILQQGGEAQPAPADPATPPVELQRADDEGPRASVTFEKGRILIRVFRKGDRSSILHELGHIWLEQLRTDASHPLASEQLRADWGAVRKYLADHAEQAVPLWTKRLAEAEKAGNTRSVAAYKELLRRAEADPQFTFEVGMTMAENLPKGLRDRAIEPYHEVFARTAEVYLQGRAPSAELRPAFAAFFKWMRGVYKSMKELNVNMTPEITDVFDRMLASQEAIDAVKEEAALGPVLKTAEQAGMTKVEFEAFVRAVRATDAKEEASLLAKVMEAVRRRKTAEWKEEREDVLQEVAEEVDAIPVVRALAILRDPEGPRLDTEMLQAIGGSDLIGRLPRPVPPIHKKGGLDPDLVAEMAGFDSGDAMLRALVETETARRERAEEKNDKGKSIDTRSHRAFLLDQAADQVMLERHGDPLHDGTIEQEAQEALHSDSRMRVLLTEVRALHRKAGEQGPVPADDVLRSWAARQVRGMKIGKLRPDVYLRAVAAAGRAAVKAAATEDWTGARKAKLQQAMNLALYRAARDAKEQSEKTFRLFARVTKAPTDKVAKSRNADMAQAARALLTAYGEGREQNNALHYMELVAAYDPELAADLKETVAEALGAAMPVSEMTVEQLASLDSVIRQLWTASRQAKVMELDGERVELEEVVAELTDRLDKYGKLAELPVGRAASPEDERRRTRQAFRAGLRRIESWANFRDGEGGGPFTRIIFRPISQAANAYRADRVKYTQRFVDLVKPLNLRRGKIDAHEIDYTFGHANGGVGMGELLHVLAHLGNPSNKRKLLLGKGWATENEDGSLDTSRFDAMLARMEADGTITKEHWDFVQGVWSLFEEIKPMAQEAHRKVYGRYFDEITAEPVVTSFGTYAGGYVPAIPDSFFVQEQALRMEQAAIEDGNRTSIFPSPPRGFTKARVEYNRPLELNLGLMPRHIDAALKFAHLAAPTRDVLRVLKNKGFSQAIAAVDPVAVPEMLLPWLNRASRQIVEMPSQGLAGRGLDAVARAIRRRTGMQLMIFNISNTVQQFTGLFPASAKVKPAFLATAVWKISRDAKGQAAEITAASPYMETRMSAQLQLIMEKLDQMLLDPTAYDKVVEFTQKHAYILQSGAQNFVDLVVWRGTYDQGRDEGLDDAEAILRADAAIRLTQGSLAAEDVSSVEAGNALVRLLLQFYPYFNAQLNLSATEMGMAGRNKDHGRVAYLYFTLIALPAMGAEVIRQALGKGFGEDEEDEDNWMIDFLWFFLGSQARYVVAFVPGVGQMANAAMARFNDNPMDDRLSVSPVVSSLEATAAVPYDLHSVVTEGRGQRKLVRDVFTAVTMITGIPTGIIARPVGYLADINEGKVEPTNPADFARGLVTGTASEASRVQ